jgi:aryl-alcohol dehydrogenase-like predicted oxidoreductase
MDYRRMGHSGTAVAHLCLGTMTFGAESTEEQSFRMMDHYASAGGNLIDTADVYAAGASEEIVGRWLKARPTEARRMVLATKGRFPMGEGPNDHGLSRVHLTRALDASLQRLGVEMVDLYQLHAWDALTPLEETLRFLDDAIRQGKIAYWGVSNFLGWQVTKAVHLAKAHLFAPPVTLQPQYNLLARDIEHEIVPACLDAGIGLLPWSPLGGGWLTGKYRRDQPPAGATRLGEDPNRGVEAYGPRASQERTWAVLSALEDIGRAHGRSQAEVALAWVAQKPAVTSVILGARTPEQLAQNLEAADLLLAAEEMARLDSASEPPVGDYPYGQKGIAQRHRRIGGGR